MTAKNDIKAKFLSGSIPKHVTTMTLSGAVGLVGVFFVDLLDLYFLSLLGEAELAAAVGYAGTLTYITLAVGIGLSIATGIVIARLLGAGESDLAKVKFASSLTLSLLVALVIVVGLIPNLGVILTQLGAQGLTHKYAMQYLTIVIPALPFLVLAMGCSAALRGLGAGKSAMFITLGGALVNGVLDPILIFGLEMGVEGAALASAISRFCMLMIGIYFLHSRYRFFIKVPLKELFCHMQEIIKLAVPAIVTNQAAPFANAYIVASIAKFGDSAVAGFSIIGRIQPVAFGLVFALSGALGPIVGQNFGGKSYDRIKRSVYFSYLFITCYVIAICLFMMAILPWLIDIFNASDEAAELLALFVNLVALSFVFNGMVFVGNAVFNNLGKPFYSSILNWSKATLGTIPFVYIGSDLMQAKGVLMGQAAGNLVFGLISFVAVILFMRRKFGALKSGVETSK